MREAIVEFWPDAAGAKPEAADFSSADGMRSAVTRLRAASVNIAYQPGEPVGKTIASVFEAVAEEHLQQPTIIYDFPVAVSPLSKNKPTIPTGSSASSFTSADLSWEMPSAS